MIDQPTGKTYLGDAVYIGRWENGAVIWTTNGVDEATRIFLEPEVISGLVRWLAMNCAAIRREA